MRAVQLRMARIALGLGVRELAAKAGVTANTITRIEKGADARQSTIDRLRLSFRQPASIIDENGGGPGVRLQKK